MGKTAAERQNKYRASRQFAGENGERRGSAYVSTRAALALYRFPTQRVERDKPWNTRWQLPLSQINMDNDTAVHYWLRPKDQKIQVYGHSEHRRTLQMAIPSGQRSNSALQCYGNGATYYVARML